MKSFQVYVVALLAFGLIGSAAQDINANSERGRKIWTEHFSDDEKLKDYLRGEFTATEGSDWQNVSTFKENYSISDDRLRAVVMSLYEEATIPNAGTISHEGGLPLDLLANNALLWLGKCADGKTKAFLLNLAADQSKDGVLRTVALFAYLRAADPEEAKDACIRFLAGESRNIDRLSVYADSETIYDETDPTNTNKRQAILAALLVAANREEEKIGFMEVDRVLSKRSDAYRRSRERLAMLERHSLEPPTANVHTDRDLKAALEEARRFKTRTRVSTNLSVLKARDFNQPLSDDDWASLTIPPTEGPASGVTWEDHLRPTRQTGRIALVATALVVLAAAGVWVIRRRRKASRP